MEIVKSTILSRFPEVLFGMSTIDGGASEGAYGLNLSYNVGDDARHVELNRKNFFEALGIEERAVAFTQQRHSCNVVCVAAPGVFPVSDGLITSQSGLFLSVSAADCTPVMLYDPVSKTVAGVHAGWRGTSACITKIAVEQMNRKYYVEPADLHVFIGPSAGECCYEVGSEVAKQFPEECTVPKSDGKYFLNVKRANALQLIQSGIKPENIEVHPDCSIHNKKYHSFRRDGKQSGRMFAVIGLQQ